MNPDVMLHFSNDSDTRKTLAKTIPVFFIRISNRVCIRIDSRIFSSDSVRD